MTAKELTPISFSNLAQNYGEHRDEILLRIDTILKSGHLIMGPEVEMFENNMAEFCGVKYAIATANGTDSLILCLKALGIGPGDEVITTPLSWISSAASIALVGAKPVFVDVQNDLNIDPGLIEKCITDKTKAIMPVHLSGRMADMDAITKIATHYKLYVIEDAAQAVGASFKGKKSGSIGHCGCFSFHPSKILAAVGDAGMVTTNDDSLASELKLLRNHGTKDRITFLKWGHNSRLDSLQAGVLNVRLKYLANEIAKRREHALIYRKLLNTKLLSLPGSGPDFFNVYSQFIIQTKSRDKLKGFLEDKGIETLVPYRQSIPNFNCAKPLGYKNGELPVSEEIIQFNLALPIHHHLSVEQIHFVAKQILNFLK